MPGDETMAACNTKSTSQSHAVGHTRYELVKRDELGAFLPGGGPCPSTSSARTRRRRQQERGQRRSAWLLGVWSYARNMKQLRACLLHNLFVREEEGTCFPAEEAAVVDVLGHSDRGQG